MSKPSKSATANRLFLAGLAHDREGKRAQAEALYLEALGVDPGHADSLHMLGVHKAQQGDLSAAAKLIVDAIKTNPDFADYHYNLAKVYDLGERHAEAEREYLEVIRLAPGNVDSLINLSNLMLRKPDAAMASRYALLALERDPKSISALNNLGLALNSLDQTEQAEQALLKAQQLNPNSADTLVNLARVYKRREDYQEAIACLRRAVAINPDLPEAYNNLGSMLKFEGRLDEALACLRKALAIAPNAKAHSNLLFNLSYHPSSTPEAIFGEHLAWAGRYAALLHGQSAPLSHEPGRDRPLRIGYVSADFKTHPVATFLKPVLAGHDRTRFLVHCYSDVSSPDAVTAWFERHADAWRSIVGLSDQRVAELVREDRIDILVDLAGHTSGNRLLVFARKPAPIQAAYLGYLGTTGLATMDYKISDAVADPPGMTEHYHTERILRLPHAMWCYSPPEQAPAVAPPPCLSNGYITFGSFNNSAKVTADVAAAWADILRRLPTARLIMMTKGDGSVHEHFLGEFVRHGISGDRIDLRRRIPMQEYLSMHREVDIALDPFPYTGGTTTCHGLWMGVPTVTLPGNKPFSRSAASILAGLELTDWIAGSVDEYIAIACRKAADPESLRRLRNALRPRMQASPLTDADRFCRGLEDLYRRMWYSYLDSEATRSIST